jgi:hypothetical protein
MNHNYFYFYVQTPKMGANDASGGGLQYALNNMHQNKFSRKLWRINPVFFWPESPRFSKVLIFMENKEVVSGDSH